MINKRVATAWRACIALAVAASTLTIAPVVAQDGDRDDVLLQSLQWRAIGPSRGGRSIAVAGDARNRLVAYMGATGGGVWKTEDGGASWRNISDGFFKTGSVGAIAVSESHPDVVYVGMGEACFRNDVSHGDGVYKSTDGGRTWIHLGLQPTRHIARIRIHPRDPNRVYVAAFGDGFGPSDARGVYRSNDGGRTWEKVLYRTNQAGAIDLVMDPANPDTIYASFLEFRRYPWGLRTAGPASGIFKTVDGGKTWTDLTRNAGLPNGLMGRIGIAVAPTRPQRLWALIDASLTERGLYRSENGGATWTRVNDDGTLTGRPWYYNHIVADPKDPEKVYVLNEEMWRSTDAGRRFSAVPVTHTDVHDLWIDPADTAHLIQANDGGGTVSFDGGLSWSTLLNQPTAQFYHVTTDGQFPYRIYGAQQDNGSISVPVRSDTGGITQADWRDEPAGEAGYLAVHPTEPIVFGGDHHWLYRTDHRVRQIQNISPNPETHYGWGSADINYRFQWTYPVLLSPHNPDVVYATAQVVFRSRDAGETWDVISPDLTRADPTTLERTPRYGRERVGEYWGPVTRDANGAEWYATIFAFAESPVRPGVLWTGSDDGYIHVSIDAGKTWSNVTPKDLPEFSLVSIIDPSPHDPGTAYVAATRFRLQDRTPYLYRTNDYGKTWTRITSGIPADDFTRVIREDPGRRGLLYSGTETGVYVSFDDGGTWRSLRLGQFPVVPVHDLIVKDGDLLVATHGRSFWVLDDLALLHQIDDQVRGATAHLFKPRTTVRFRGNADHPLRGMGFGAHAFEGQNPPNGVVIHYYLKEAPREDVRLTITDTGGRPIHTYSSNDRTLTAKPGANRLVWNLRYPGPHVIEGTVLHRDPDRPLAPPGTYHVTLSIGGQRLAQTLQVVKDPRLPYTDADLHGQFTFLIGLRDKMTQTHDTVRRIRTLRGRAEQIASKASGTTRESQLAGALKALNDQLYPIEEVLTQYRATTEKDLTSNPSGIDNKLAVLAYFTARADARPTAAARALFERLARAVDMQAAAVDQVMRDEWRRFVAASAEAR